MISDADTFWRHILGRIRPERGNDVLSAQEAEQRMAAAGEDPISEERVARIVRSATGAAAPRPRALPARVHRFPMARPALRWAVAATVALAPLAAVAFYKLYDVAPAPPVSASWDYPTAIRLLLDESLDELSRRDAQARLLSFVKELGFETARLLRAEGGSIGSAAEATLSRWRANLTTPEPGAVGSVTPILDLAKELRGHSASEDDRLRMLTRLGDEIASGIAALRAPVGASPGFQAAQQQAMEQMALSLRE